MAEKKSGARVVQVQNHIIGPSEQKARRVTPRKIGDYPSTPQVCLDLAGKLATPLLGNTPICDELVAFIQHTWTEEEASTIRHLHPMRWTSAEEIAKAEGSKAVRDS